VHELAVTQNVLEIVLRHADNHRIRRIDLVVGQLSTMVDDSVQFYWDIICRGTCAEGARLHFQRIPAQMRCTRCGTIFKLNGDFVCPTCASAAAEVISGEEFYVDSIEVEEEVEKEEYDANSNC